MQALGFALRKGHAPVVYMQGSGGAPAAIKGSRPVLGMKDRRCDGTQRLTFLFLAPDLVRDE